MEKGYWGLRARKCDSCKTSPAVLHCSADAAYLCLACDSLAHHHHRNHGRVWLCEVCEQAPAAVTCKADAAALCLSCDADVHAANPLARRHDRVPLLPFLHPVPAAKPPSSSAAAAAAADDEEEWKGMAALALAPDLNFLADVDPYLDLDYADGIVPVQGKKAGDGGGGGGGAPTSAMVLPEGVVELDFALAKATYSSYAANSFSHSVSSSEVGVVPDGVISSDVSTKPRSSSDATTFQMDRVARVMRYREKRKSRRFEKTIRYASRKAYAETRPRIKGRFAKRGGGGGGGGRGTEMENDAAASAADVDHRIFLDSAFLVDNGYGVVPSY